MKTGDLVRFTKLPPGGPSDNVVRCQGGGWLCMVERISGDNVELQVPAKVSDGGPLPIFNHMGVEKVRVPLDTVELVTDGMVANIERCS